jgi:glutaminyl-peptide cyclotransferase
MRLPWAARVCGVVVVLAGQVSCGHAGSGAGAVGGAGPATVRPERLAVQVLAVLPHDRSRFTEGLELRDGVLYESSGLYGRSVLWADDWRTGAVLARAALPNGLFGEGITVVGDRVWQLTWREGVALERRRTDLAVLGEVRYQGQGWGLCSDGRRLVMSDGSGRLTFRDPRGFARTGAVEVTDAGRPVRNLNALACVDGAVWANVWQSDDLLRIDPASGAVTGVADASGLLTPAERPGTDVLNGIAALPGGGSRFLLTGKFWPRMFQVALRPASPPSAPARP